MSCSTVTALNAEWAELTRDTRPTVAGWRQRCTALTGADDLDDVLTGVRRAPDQVLASLLSWGAAGDRLAWRVVLQAMLGKAVLVGAGSDDRVAEAVSELWVVIAEYPLQRRPRSIAANLSWMLRRRLAPTPLVAPEPEVVEPGAGATLAHARRLGLLEAAEHELLWLVYVEGLTSASAAQALGVSAELVRYRCSRTLRRLADHASLLAA